LPLQTSNTFLSPGDSVTFISNQTSANSGRLIAFFIINPNGLFVDSRAETIDATGIASWTTIVPDSWENGAKVLCRDESTYNTSEYITLIISP
jgi:hypothetical protein